jgi:hypothetical protein
VSNTIVLAVSPRERDLILGALRNLQRVSGVPADIEDILTNDGEHRPPSDEDIDDLCEGINAGDNDVTARVKGVLNGAASLREVLENTTADEDDDEVVVTA